MDEGEPVRQAGFEVGHLSRRQRGDLTALLAENQIPHTYVGTELRAPAFEAEMVELLIEIAAGDVVLAGPPPTDSFAAGPPLDDLPSGRLRVAVPLDDPDAEPLYLASRWRRLIAYLVEAMGLGILAVALQIWSPGAARAFALASAAISGIVMVAVIGATLGMCVLKMRVVVPPRAGPPGWWVAIVRYLVAWWPSLIGIALLPITDLFTAWWFVAIDRIWFLACYGAIFFDPMARGLHDRVAGTVVVDGALPLTA